jgi:hypothetical protein
MTMPEHCEMDREPYRGLPWGTAAAVVLAAWLASYVTILILRLGEGCK